MTITVDWANRAIFVPRLDTTLTGTDPTTGRELRQLDVDAFRTTLNTLQASETGMTFPTTHVHTTPSTLAGVTYARRVEIINGYTITFEDGTYAVSFIGADSNLGDVTTVNGVQIRSANSAGSTIPVTPESMVTELMEHQYESTETYAEWLRLIRAALVGETVATAAGAFDHRDLANTKTRVAGNTDLTTGSRTITSTDGTP